MRSLALLLLALLRSRLVAAPAEQGWDAERLSGLDLTSEPVAMQWDSSGRLWLLERETAGGAPGSRIWVVDPPPVGRGEVRARVWAQGLPESTGFEVSTSSVWLASGSRLVRLNGAADARAAERAIPWLGWGSASGHGTIFRSLVAHRDGWLYGALEADGPVTPQIMERGLVAPARLRPGVIRLHPALRILEQFTEGPLHAQAIAFTPAGDLIVATSGRLGLFHAFAGGVFIPRDAYPRPLNSMLDVQESIVPSVLQRPGALALVIGEPVADPSAVAQQDVVWVRYSNASSWFPTVIKSSGAALTVRGTTSPAARPQDAKVVGSASDAGVAGPGGTLFFRSQGGLVRMTPRVRDRRVPGDAKRFASLSARELAEAWAGSFDSWEGRIAERAFLERGDAEAAIVLSHLCATSSVASVRAAALQIYAGKPGASLDALRGAVMDRSAEVRVGAARALGERRGDAAGAWGLLVALAADPDPRIRREVALATRRLILAKPLPARDPSASARDVGEAFQVLGPVILTSARLPDSLVASAVWSAVEPLVASAPIAIPDALRGLGESALPMSGPLLKKAVRSTFAAGEEDKVDRLLERLLVLADESPALCAFGLEGMMQGQKTSKAWAGHKGVKRLLRKLAESGNTELAAAAQRVDALCGNPKAQEGLLTRINNAALSDGERIKAIEFTRWVPSEEAKATLWELLKSSSSVDLKVVAVDSLREIGASGDAASLLSFSDQAAPPVRTAILESFESREAWWPALLGGVESGRVSRGEVPVGLGAALRHHPNPKLRARALAALGADPGGSQ
ncbi:MAG: hypothetical protein HYR88_04755 [Verrucomicrobia bacterium]|nr:hypothetical protein [Verrucomicrobiota bacterium]